MGALFSIILYYYYGCLQISRKWKYAYSIYGRSHTYLYLMSVINILFMLAATISTSTNLASHQNTTGWATSASTVPDRDQRPRSSTAPIIVATVPTNKNDRKSNWIFKVILAIIYCILKYFQNLCNNYFLL